jgi:hypothetical protein
MTITRGLIIGSAAVPDDEDDEPQTWDERSNGDDVVRAFSLDENWQRGPEQSYNATDGGTNFGANYGIWWPTTPAGSVAATRTPPALIDSTVKPYGQKGAMKFELPPTSVGVIEPSIGDHSDDMGEWFFNVFSSVAQGTTAYTESAQGFHENETFFVQWRQKFNQACVEEILLRGDQPQGGIKQVIINCTDGDSVIRVSSNSLKLVVQTYHQFRVPQLYVGFDGTSVTDASLAVPGGISGGVIQSEMGEVSGVYCSVPAMEALQADSPTQLLNPPAACVAWVADEWMTFQLMMDNGPFDSGTNQFEWTVYKFWMGREGEAQVLVHHWDSRIHRPSDQGHYAEAVPKFGKFWVGPYMTGYQGGNVETLKTWYSEFIVSRSFIPDPLDHTPNSFFSSMVSGDAKLLGTYPGQVGDHWNRQSISDFSGMAYSPRRNKMYMFGGGHASTNYDAIDVLDLSAASPNFTALHPASDADDFEPENVDTTKGAWISGSNGGPYPRPIARHTINNLHVVDDELISLSFIEGNGSVGIASKASWDEYRPEAVCTFDLGANTVLKTAHGRFNDEVVRFYTTGVLPTPLVEADNYYIINKTDDTFQVSATLSGSALDLGGSPTGTTHFPSVDYASFEVAGDTYSRMFGGTHAPGHFNFETETWSFGSTAVPTSEYSASEYDPILKKIFVIGDFSGNFKTYEPTTKLTTLHTGFTKEIDSGGADSTAFETNGCLVFCPKDGKHYFFSLSAVAFRIEANRANLNSGSKSVKLTVTGTVPTSGTGEMVKMVWVPGIEKFAGWIKAGNIYTFEPITKVWAEIALNVLGGAGSIGNQAFHCLAYTPVDDVMIFTTTEASGFKVWSARL